MNTRNETRNDTRPSALKVRSALRAGGWNDASNDPPVFGGSAGARS